MKTKQLFLVFFGVIFFVLAGVALWDIFVSGTGWHVQAFIISVYAFIGMVAVGEKSNGKNSSEGTTLH